METTKPIPKHWGICFPLMEDLKVLCSSSFGPFQLNYPCVDIEQLSEASQDSILNLF
jgi:hypothetical protein